MGEVAVGLAVEELRLHAECLQQVGQDDAANGVDAIYHHAETSFSDGFGIDQLQGEHAVDVLLVDAVVFAVVAHVVHVGEVEIFGLGNGQNLLTLGFVEELALMVEQLQRIPMARIVRRGDDDAAVGLEPAHGQFRGRRGGKADIDHVVAHAHERAADDVFHHLARDAGIAPHDDAIVLRLGRATNERGIGRCKFHDIKWIQRVAGTSANGAANAGNRFD